MKTYKHIPKVNKNKKKHSMEETGESHQSNSEKRFPIIALPPVVNNPILQSYRRFINNSSDVTGSVTIFDLLNQFGSAVSSTTIYPYVRCVRIKKVRVLCPVTTQGTSVSCYLQPQGIDTLSNNFNSLSQRYSDSSASIDVPAYLSLTPSLDTPLGSWHYNINIDSGLLALSVPAGSTLDILFEYILAVNSNLAPGYVRTVSAATAGRLYGAPILTNLLPADVTYI